MQTLSGYKFRYEFVKGELNILPDLLSQNPAMYSVRGNEDPLVTLIPASQVIPPPSPPPTLDHSPHSGCWSLLPGVSPTGHLACTPRNPSPQCTFSPTIFSRQYVSLLQAHS
ncbi:hypothetical protein DSO57_1027643 [Entomophthora muscae]|uniref:Uncharacterized protein n=1 Tax=Entomophthora muscae TaxID=34485 RepID=A0ACC2SRB0_9FUNG|nr:hypothetical protein DSO57_1027643 [Entomophthora muscae]